MAQGNTVQESAVLSSETDEEDKVNLIPYLDTMESEDEHINCDFESASSVQSDDEIDNLTSSQSGGKIPIVVSKSECPTHDFRTSDKSTGQQALTLDSTDTSMVLHSNDDDNYNFNFDSGSSSASDVNRSTLNNVIASTLRSLDESDADFLAFSPKNSSKFEFESASPSSSDEGNFNFDSDSQSTLEQEDEDNDNLPVFDIVSTTSREPGDDTENSDKASKSPEQSSHCYADSLNIVSASAGQIDTELCDAESVSEVHPDAKTSNLVSSSTVRQGGKMQDVVAPTTVQIGEHIVTLDPTTLQAFNDLENVQLLNASSFLELQSLEPKPSVQKESEVPKRHIPNILKRKSLPLGVAPEAPPQVFLLVRQIEDISQAGPGPHTVLYEPGMSDIQWPKLIKKGRPPKISSHLISSLSQKKVRASKPRMSKLKVVEHALYQWFNNKKSATSIWNEKMFIMKAQELGRALGLTDFEYTPEWAEDYKKRFKIKDSQFSKMTHHAGVIRDMLHIRQKKREENINSMTGNSVADGASENSNRKLDIVFDGDSEENEPNDVSREYKNFLFGNDTVGSKKLKMEIYDETNIDHDFLSEKEYGRNTLFTGAKPKGNQLQYKPAEQTSFADAYSTTSTDVTNGDSQIFDISSPVEENDSQVGDIYNVDSDCYVDNSIGDDSSRIGAEGDHFDDEDGLIAHNNSQDNVSHMVDGNNDSTSKITMSISQNRVQYKDTTEKTLFTANSQSFNSVATKILRVIKKPMTGLCVVKQLHPGLASKNRKPIQESEFIDLGDDYDTADGNGSMTLEANNAENVSTSAAMGGHSVHTGVSLNVETPYVASADIVKSEHLEKEDNFHDLMTEDVALARINKEEILSEEASNEEKLLVLMRDKEFEFDVNEDEERAQATLPDGLVIRPSGIDGEEKLGVFTMAFIPNGVCFGPYEGKILKKANFGECRNQWKIYMNMRVVHYLDGSDTSIANWMQFVLSTDDTFKQNIEVFQHKQKLYFRTMVDIPENVELLMAKNHSYRLTAYSGIARMLHDSKTRARCTICGMKFKAVRIAMTHYQFHRRELQYDCLACGECFQSQYKLRCHKLQAHANEAPFVCYRCDCGFPSPGLLYIHKDKVHNDYTLTCRICLKAFRGRNDSLMHVIAEHQVFANEIYDCEICGEQFRRERDLQRHMEKHQKLKYHCIKCNLYFSAFSELMTHRKLTHRKRKTCETEDG